MADTASWKVNLRMVFIARMLTWHQLEEWQKDNEYITQGYRRWAESLKLLFVWTLVDRDLDRRTAGKDVSIPSLDVRGFETQSS